MICDRCGSEYYESDGGCFICTERDEERFEYVIARLVRATIIEAAMENEDMVWFYVEEDDGPEEFTVPREVLRELTLDFSHAENVDPELLEELMANE